MAQSSSLMHIYNLTFTRRVPKILEMKLQLAVALWATTANAQLPSFADITSPFFIEGISKAFDNLMKTLGTASGDFFAGTTLPVIFDQTLPKILTEVKLLKKTELEPANPIRAGSVTAKAAYGPYVLVGKNVSLR